MGKHRRTFIAGNYRLLRGPQYWVRRAVPFKSGPQTLDRTLTHWVCGLSVMWVWVAARCETGNSIRSAGNRKPWMTDHNELLNNAGLRCFRDDSKNKRPHQNGYAEPSAWPAQPLRYASGRPGTNAACGWRRWMLAAEPGIPPRQLHLHVAYGLYRLGAHLVNGMAVQKLLTSRRDSGRLNPPRILQPSRGPARGTATDPRALLAWALTGSG
jgi:hypothetical protein